MLEPQLRLLLRALPCLGKPCCQRKGERTTQCWQQKMMRNSNVNPSSRRRIPKEKTQTHQPDVDAAALQSRPVAMKTLCCKSWWHLQATMEDQEDQTVLPHELHHHRQCRGRVVRKPTLASTAEGYYGFRLRAYMRMNKSSLTWYCSFNRFVKIDLIGKSTLSRGKAICRSTEK